MAPKVGKNLSVDGDTQKCLVLIMGVLAGQDYNYFAGGFNILGTNDSNRSKIKVTMSVIVPEGQLETAAKKIKSTMNADGYDVDFGDGYKWVNVYLGDMEKTKTRIKIQIKVEKVKKEFDKPSGVNKGSGGGSANTAIVESAQCLYCDLAFNVYKGKIDEESLISKDDFDKAYSNIDVDANLDEMLSMASAWKKSSIRGANRLYEEFHSDGTYKFYRGKGVDAEINKAYARVKADKVVAESESIKDKVPQSEDKWNPADIWAAQATFDITSIEKASKPGLILNLNAFLVKEFNAKNLIGISLKKITGDPHLSPMNKTADRKIDDVGLHGSSFSYESLDTYIDFKGTTSVQFRNFSSSKGSWQGEVGIKGSSAKHGKIGGGAVWDILRAHGITVGNGIDNNTQLYTDLGNGQKKMPYAKKIYKLLKDTPSNDRTMTSNETQEIDDIVSNGQRWMYAKYLGLSLIDKIKSANNSDEIVQDIYLYASSQHSLSGVYYKLT